MQHYVEIIVRAPIPEGDRHLGHEAVYKSGESVSDVVKVLNDIGLKDVEVTREIVKRTGPKAKAGA